MYYFLHLGQSVSAIANVHCKEKSSLIKLNSRTTCIYEFMHGDFEPPVYTNISMDNVNHLVYMSISMGISKAV